MIDPAMVDWRQEWDSVSAILHYIEQGRGRPGRLA